MPAWKTVRRPNIKNIISDMRKANVKMANLYGDALIEAHEEFVENWELKPEFKKTLKKRGPLTTVKVKPTGDPDAVDRWWWINSGTGTYIGKGEIEITPKKPGGVLAINLGYKPKTTRTSYGGPGKASGPVIFRKKVIHKGIKPRKFDLRAKPKALMKVAGQYVRLIGKAFRR